MSVEVQALKLEEFIDKAGDMKVLPTVMRKVRYTHPEVGSLITVKWSFPKVISSIILQHHRDEETRPPMEHAGTLKAHSRFWPVGICPTRSAGFLAQATAHRARPSTWLIIRRSASWISQREAPPNL